MVGKSPNHRIFKLLHGFFAIVEKMGTLKEVLPTNNLCCKGIVGI